MDPHVVLNAGLGQTSHPDAIARRRDVSEAAAGSERAAIAHADSFQYGDAPVLAGGYRRAMRLQESAHVAHCQRDPVFGFFPGVEAHLRPPCKRCRFHDGGIRMSRGVIRQDQNGRLAGAQTKSAWERYIVFRKASTIFIEISDRRAHSTGPQPLMLFW